MSTRRGFLALIAGGAAAAVGVARAEPAPVALSGCVPEWQARLMARGMARRYGKTWLMVEATRAAVARGDDPSRIACVVSDHTPEWAIDELTRLHVRILRP